MGDSQQARNCWKDGEIALGALESLNIEPKHIAIPSDQDGARLEWPHLESVCAVLNDPAEVEFNPAILWQCKAPGEVKASNFSDPRINAVIAVNPVSNPIFSPTSMHAMTAPVLIVSGTKDIFAPPISDQTRTVA
jgi:predicted dienelactone hydrolase